MAWTPDPAWLPQHSAAGEPADPTDSLATALASGGDTSDTQPAVTSTWKPAPAVVRAWQKTGHAHEQAFTAPDAAAGMVAHRTVRRVRPLVAGGGALAAAMAVGVGVLAFSNSDAKSPVAPPQVPTARPTASPVVALCPDRTHGAAITTAGPGSDQTGAGVIAALDHAYYTQRDATRVSALMVKAPSSVPAIQAAIDAVPTGTTACVTAAPDTHPDTWVVDVRLHGPDGADSWLHQRITVTKVGEQFKVARIEDRT